MAKLAQHAMVMVVFGYDPVFWVPEQNRSAAELDKNTKNSISHRGKALVQLMQRMKVVLTR